MHTGTETRPDLHGEAGLTSVGGASPLVCPCADRHGPGKSCICVYWGMLGEQNPLGSNVMHTGDITFSSGHIKKVKMKLIFTNYFDLCQPIQNVLLMCN